MGQLVKAQLIELSTEQTDYERSTVLESKGRRSTGRGAVQP